MNKAVQLVILIRMRTPSSQLRLVEFCQRCRVGGIRNTEDVIHGIVTIPVLHHSLTIRCKVHHLQTFTLPVVGIGRLRAVAELRIDRMTVLVVTYPVNYNALTTLFIACKALYLSGSIVVIGNIPYTNLSSNNQVLPISIKAKLKASP